MKIRTFIWLATVLCMDSASAAGDWITLRSGTAPNPAATVTAGPNAAKSNSSSSARAVTSSQGGSALGVGSQGQSLSFDSHATYEAQSRNPVSTAAAPALTSSNDTCMGSTSVGASAVSLGISIGSTWTDNNCLMLKNSREMWNMGFKGAALARMCMDEQNRAALEATGINCPNGVGNTKSVKWQSGAQNTDNDSSYR
ncbi:MAG: hypothetical protein JWQ21_753 [Herminiimonas sp.]|nr:hypothetical protein [Herminiimonas sp.]